MKSKNSINCVSKLLLISLAGTFVLSMSSISAALSQDAAATPSMEKPLEFVVVFDASADAHNAWSSDAIVAHLKNDLVLNGRLAASAGAVVKGHVEPIDRKGDVISRQSAQGRSLNSTLPFRIVFDEIVSSKNRSLKMHAVPSNQYSMLNLGRSMRSLEVTTGGVVKTAQIVNSGEQIRLQEGDELVVKIGQMKNSGKQKMLEPIADSAVGTTNSDASGSSSSAGMWSSSLDSITPQAKNKNANSESEKEPAGGSSLAELGIKGGSTPAPEWAKGSASESSSSKEPADKSSAKSADAGDTIDGSNTNNSDSVNKTSTSAGTKTGADQAFTETSTKPADLDSLAIAAATPPRVKGKSKEFRIAFQNPVFTKTARVGDKTQAVLLEDMKIHGNLIAKKGDGIYGHVVALRSSRHWGGAIAASSERFQRDAGITIVFTKIVTASGERLSIDGRVPQQLSVFNNQGVFKRVTVGEMGEVIKDEAVDDGGQSAATVSKDILKMGATAMMGPAAAIATPLIMVGAMVKAEPLMMNSFQKTFISKGAEVYIAAGDEVVVQARMVSPDASQRAVSGKVIGGKPNKQKVAVRRATTP